MMVARVTLTICAAIITLAAANIEFKHHNNTELAAILQQVRLDRKYREFYTVLGGECVNGRAPYNHQ